MRKYIKHIQSKPEPVRKKLLIISMTASTVLVGIVWMFSIYRTVNPSVSENTPNTITPFKLFGESVSQTYKNISASVGNIQVNTPAPVPVLENNSNVSDGLTDPSASDVTSGLPNE